MKARLRRGNLEWLLETTSGELHRITALDEPHYSSKVDRAMDWVVTVSGARVTAVTAKHHGRRGSVYAKPGGAFEGGRSRRH